MRFSNWDAYFHMATHGDKEAYQFLYKQFANKAKYIIRIALKEYTNLVVNPEDFCEFIDYLFLRIINEYDFNRGAFRKYCDYVMTVFTYVCPYLLICLIGISNVTPPRPNSWSP